MAFYKQLIRNNVFAVLEFAQEGYALESTSV